MNDARDRRFLIETDEGPLLVVISADLLRGFAGRSHVTVDEVLEIYRSELENAALAKARRSGDRSIIRLEAKDL